MSVLCRALLMLYRERASTRHLFGRSTRVPPSPSRGRTSARPTEVAVMLLHFLHFCNSLFTSPRMRRPEHGAYGAPGLWRRATAWSARPACLPPWHTRRIPRCRPQHAASAVDGRVPTSARHGRRAPWQAPRAQADRRRAPAWLRPRRCTAHWAGRTRSVSQREPSPGASAGGRWQATAATGTPPIRRPAAASVWGVAHHGHARRGRRSQGHGAQRRETGVRTYGRPGCVPTGDRVRTYGRPGAYLRETNFTLSLFSTNT